MTAILFDLYGVLLKIPTADEEQRLIARAGSPAIMEHYHRLRPDYDSGQLSDRAYWEQVRRAAGLEEIDWAEMTDLDSQITRAHDPEMVDYALSLIDRGLRVGILSNLPATLAANLRREHDFFDRFHSVTFSGDIGVAKPNKRAFTIALQSMGTPAAETLFFDDRPDYLEGALAAGLNAHLFTGIDQAREIVELTLKEYEQ